MIKFNNKTFENISDLIYIEDIVVSPISLEPTVRARPVQFGSEFVRMSGGTRNITISFALLDIDINERQALIQDIRDWAFTTTEKTMQLPMYEDRHLECICTQFPDDTYRKWWENKLKLVFTCFNNPYWTSDELIEVRTGTTFSIGGSAPPLMTIERSGSTKLMHQTFASKTESMTFSEIPAGSLVINLNRQTAAIGSTSIMKYYANDSTWIVPKVGANQVISGVGTVKYRERWV